MELEKMTVLADMPRTGEATDAIPTPVAGRASPIVLVVEHDPVVADTLTTPLRQALSYGVDIRRVDGAVPGARRCRRPRLGRSGSAGAFGTRPVSPVVGGDARRRGPSADPRLNFRRQARGRGRQLCAGADDYVPTPCHPVELLARTRVRLQVRALERVALGPRAPLGPAGGPVHPSNSRIRRRLNRVRGSRYSAPRRSVLTTRRSLGRCPPTNQCLPSPTARRCCPTSPSR